MAAGQVQIACRAARTAEMFCRPRTLSDLQRAGPKPLSQAMARPGNFYLLSVVRSDQESTEPESQTASPGRPRSQAQLRVG